MVFISKSASRVVLGVFSAALFVATVNAQSPGQPSPGVAPSEANHFIETPKGWVHPRTPWGDPDLTGVWPIAHGLNLVRSCPRAGGPGRGGAPAAAPAAAPCDPDHIALFKTEAVYAAEVERALGVRKTGDAATQALAKGNFGAALQGGVTDPTFPERQTSMIDLGNLAIEAKTSIYALKLDDDLFDMSRAGLRTAPLADRMARDEGIEIVTGAARGSLFHIGAGIDGALARRRAHGEAPPAALARLIGANRRRYGGYLVHAQTTDPSSVPAATSC